MKKIYLSCIFVFLIFSKLAAVTHYTEYWQQFFWKIRETDRSGIRMYLRAETGNHWESVRSLLLSPQLAYKINKDIVMEVHYSYIEARPLLDYNWKQQHRLELEFNKIFRLSCDRQIATRNRLEFRWRKESEAQPDIRFRQRTMFVAPLKINSSLKEFSCYNEVFYDMSRERFDQDRFCPCQLTFAITDKIELDAYILFRVVEENKAYIKSLVMGTQLNF